MFGLFRWKQNPQASSRKPQAFLRMKYDAAQTTPENARHWSMADNLSADGSMTPEIRRTLRNRSRYEVNNNAYARGMVLTLADVCIGTGPRLQMLSEDKEFNSIVETEFAAWAETVRLAEKLKTLRMAKIADGEAFCAILRNPRLKHPVEIDIRLIEADRVTTPFSTVWDEVDGIEYDNFGNPIQYNVSTTHPGDSSAWYGKFESIPAEFMIHWYRVDRPGQSRGLPEIMAALPLFAQLRRYTLAVLAAAETAADFAAVLYTDAPAGGDAQPLEPLDLVTLEKRMATVIPDGWKLAQIRAEQPTTTYSEFKREILGEIGRCLQMPVNILLGDSSKHNYASGRLDHQSFYKSIKVEQHSCEQIVLRPIFEAWLREALRKKVIRPEAGGWRKRGQTRPFDTVCSQDYSLQSPASSLTWYWDGLEHVDPMKEAKAAVARVDGNITNLAIECAKNGYDWEEVLIQRAREQNRMRELGISESKRNNDTNNEEQDDEENDTDERDAAAEPRQNRMRKERRNP
jgi:lambda family phage portal protein